MAVSTTKDALNSYLDTCDPSNEELSSIDAEEAKADTLPSSNERSIRTKHRHEEDSYFCYCEEVNSYPLLTDEEVIEAMKVLDEINKNRGTTILMATHDEKIVNKMKKQVITLKDGHLVNFKQKGKYQNEAI